MPRRDRLRGRLAADWVEKGHDHLTIGKFAKAVKCYENTTKLD